MIGDPSFKAQERALLDDQRIEQNVAGIRAVIENLLDTKGPDSARILNNADWFSGISFITFLRDVGKHFTVNHMMAKESIRARLEDREHGISYTEFSYVLLQAYDFLYLNEHENCRLQIGGSDQWGNVVAGTDLIRRVKGSNEGIFGITLPLVMKADGTKFGKTEQGTIWLSASKTSPYQFYQFFIQTADADVITFIKFFTFLSHEKILQLEESVRMQPEKREAQQALAREVTRLIHGDAELQRVERASQALFGSSIRELDGRTLLEVLGEAPSTKIPRARVEQGIPLIDLVVETGLSASKGAARKEITAGGIYINNERTADVATLVTEGHLIANQYVVLRKGKKNYHLVEFN
ncbi:MAG: tyrosine--tRNA ligase [Bdellovibrionales bacterium GWB1_55_8]|nr:MAG: tyrosine--tRNA ligase [Bdellovibrionales bacterium GWB1_55_8]